MPAHQTGLKIAGRSLAHLIEILATWFIRAHSPSFMVKLKEALKYSESGFATFSCWRINWSSLEPIVSVLFRLENSNGAHCLISLWNSCLWSVGLEQVGGISSGEVVIISVLHHLITATDTQLAVCSMEYIYFATDSNIKESNVHTARKHVGAQLA